MKLELLQENLNEKNSSGNDAFPANVVGLFVDTETNVEYFIMNSGAASAICPRIGKDGRPILHKKNI